MAEEHEAELDWTAGLPSTPVDRTDTLHGSLHDEIYARLRQALIMGDLVPGQTFSMRALADRFRTSLIPVRDALKRLIAERALTMTPNRTVFVPLMTRQRFQELLQVRLSLEPMLARRAAELISPAQVADLDGTNNRMQASVSRADVKRYLAANYHFHFGLYRAAKSDVILPIVESLWMQIGPFFHAVFTRPGTEAVRDNHAEVLKALRRRDPIGAGNAVTRDLADSADLILANVEFIYDKDGEGETDEAPTRRRSSRPQSRTKGAEAAAAFDKGG